MRKVIYSIKNTVNGKTYIGQTSNFKNRMSQHKWNAETEFLDRPLYTEMKAYGINSFEFKVIEDLEGSSVFINQREQEWIKSIPTELRYNVQVENEYKQPNLHPSKQSKTIIGTRLVDGKEFTYESVYRAAIELTGKRNTGAISKCLSKQANEVYGFVWRYADDSLNNFIPKPRKDYNKYTRIPEELKKKRGPKPKN